MKKQAGGVLSESQSTVSPQKCPRESYTARAIFLHCGVQITTVIDVYLECFASVWAVNELISISYS